MLLSWLNKNHFKWYVAIGHILVVSMLVQFCLKTFPMAEVSIFLNCGPLLTVILGGLFLENERVTYGSVIKAIMAFIGVLLITLGAPKVDSSSTHIEVQWYNYILMALMPVVIAIGNLAMGELRSLNPLMVPFYGNTVMMVVFFFVCLIDENGFLPKEIEQ